MNFEIPDQQLQVWISGFETRPQNIDQLFRSISEAHPKSSVQIVDLDKVPGQRYLKLATINAVKSFTSGRPIAKTLGMEVLLYLSAQRQIQEALRHVGVASSTRRVAAIVVGHSFESVAAVSRFLEETLGRASDDSLLEDWPKHRVENVRTGFDIGRKELRATIGKKEQIPTALERLALERSALVAAKK